MERSHHLAYSQLFEDVYVHKFLLNVPREDIVLVEIGAFDPVLFSNTAMLEKALKSMPAFLVEPNPEKASIIKKGRPDSQVLQLAVASEFAVFDFSGDSATAGIEQFICQDHYDISDNKSSKVIAVPMRAIQSILPKNYIDFLSIDVQGAELEVLKGADFSMPIGVICIELEGFEADKDECCREILRVNGFRRAAVLHVSEIWVNRDYPRRDLVYDVSLAGNSVYTKNYSKKGMEKLKRLQEKLAPQFAAAKGWNV